MNNMKRILVTGAGGPATNSFVRSLRDAEEEYCIIGVDAGKYNLFRAETDCSYLCPKATDEAYIPFINMIIERENIDLIHSQPEIEIYELSKHRDELNCKHFMPKHETVEVCRDKMRSNTHWHVEGIKVPESILINDKADLHQAYFWFRKERIWLRDIVGAAGKGSLSRPTFEQALAHINARDGWGNTMISVHLTDKTITWQSIWHDGQLIVAQGRRRLYWEFANRAQSGVTGLTGTGVTVKDSELDELAIRCIHAVDEEPHGIFSVDFTFDWDGVPNPTEINIGKFFTTHHFLTRTGCNMPEIFVKLAFDEYEFKKPSLNPCEEEMYWIRGIDTLPKLVSRAEVDKVQDEYARNLKEAG